MLDFKKLFTSVADASLRLIGKRFVKKDLTTALQFCDDLISFKGIASGIAIAREITDIYSTFDTDQKLSFFKEINNRFAPSKNEVEKKITHYLSNKNDKSLKQLGEAVEGKRQELIRRLNMAPNGTPFLVSMREDLIKFLPINTELVFLFAEPTAPMPQAKRRKDGTKRTHSEWAQSRGFKWFSAHSIPKEWIDESEPLEEDPEIILEVE